MINKINKIGVVVMAAVAVLLAGCDSPARMQIKLRAKYPGSDIVVIPGRGCSFVIRTPSNSVLVAVPSRKSDDPTIMELFEARK